MILLYGTNASSLQEANALLESTLGLEMQPREGLYNGGDYYLLRLKDHSLKLRENIDLDDTEREFDGLHEPEFPNVKWLLYVEGERIPQEILNRLDQLPTTFVKLRST